MNGSLIERQSFVGARDRNHKMSSDEEFLIVGEYQQFKVLKFYCDLSARQYYNGTLYQCEQCPVNHYVNEEEVCA